MGLAGAELDRPEMTPDVVFKAIAMLKEGTLHGEDMKLKPTLMCFDYMQLIPTGRYTRQKWEAVYEAVNACKRLGIRVGCSVVVAAQAGREVDSFKDRMPRLASGQMTSAIEQSSDKMLGIARPRTFMQEGTRVEGKDGHDYEVCDTLLVMRLLKQRLADTGFTFYLMFNPATFTLGQAQWI